jgi:deoxycytidylate deaminase
MVTSPAIVPMASQSPGRDSRTAVLENAANELVFAVVGHVGSGTSTIAEALMNILASPSLEGGAYEATVLKARVVIANWADQAGEKVPSTDRPDLGAVESFQDLGDEMRLKAKDNAAVAKGMILNIRQLRAQKRGLDDPGLGPVIPDGKRRAYILDSIRHPAEVELLRHIYQDAFILIGVVCEEQRRLSRVMKKYEDAGETKARRFMKRDEKAAEKHGQRVSDAFHLSDFFVDNTVERFEPSGAENEAWDINAKLRRLVRIITHSAITRPEIGETAMQHAHSAAMQSACLSRQVGAALVDANGNVVATGTNEVPQAGGGLYGERFEETEDHRCAFRRTGSPAYCSNSREQIRIVDELIDEVPELKAITDPIRRNSIRQLIRRGRVGDLLEFSRAVHAEMDAVLSAGREGISTIGTRLYVTTFPCHYCARHLVSAGVDEVQFIEPYPKSQALGLHADAIQLEATGWLPPSRGGMKVLFRPFVGVAPRLYRRAFLKDRELKNSDTGNIETASPEWGTPWHLRTVGYPELEAALIKQGQ